jgi:hypothetical protein
MQKSPPTTEKHFEQPPAPVSKPDPLAVIVGLLTRLVRLKEQEQGGKQTLHFWEADLTTGQTLQAYNDVGFNRWVIWTRNTANAATGADYIRISQSATVPLAAAAQGEGGALDLNAGRSITLPAAGRLVTVLNAGTAQVHVNIVADSGAEFKIG